MAEHILMTALSPTMDRGTVSSWLKNEGDKIENGDIICEIETDKATMDYESVQEGLLLKILVQEGESAEIGVPIAVIGAEGEDISSLVSGAKAAAGTPPLKEDSKPGTDAGVKKPRPEAAAGAQEEWVLASPLARAMAEKSNLNIRGLQGSGPGGRVVKRDIEAALAGGGVPVIPAEPAVKPASAAVYASAVSGLRAEEKPVSQKRKIIAQRLAESKFSAPHYYLKVRVIMDGLLQAREDLNKKLKGKISFNAFLMKFAAEALKRHPVVNASWQGSTIKYFGTADIALAVAQPDGLITPVVRDCGSKGILAIDNELKDLIERALSGKLKPEEYTGATFTLSNLGSFGIDEFTAIINPPGSAILAVGAVNRVVTPPPENGGSFGVEKQAAFTLSCDHRVIDGAAGAAFLNDMKQGIEKPVTLLY